jgi:hypothetical protein
MDINTTNLIKGIVRIAWLGSYTYNSKVRTELTRLTEDANIILNDTSKLSDGSHTFEELYEHRHVLCLALMRSMAKHWWFSLRHADGEWCYDGEWFIVGADLPEVGSITYHLPIRLLEAARATGAAELPLGRPWDGHTSDEVVTRLILWSTNKENRET